MEVSFPNWREEMARDGSSALVVAMFPKRNTGQLARKRNGTYP
jgi:hypothetical protein